MNIFFRSNYNKFEYNKAALAPSLHMPNPSISLCLFQPIQFQFHFLNYAY